MTRVIFEAKDKKSLKPYIALAKSQGIIVKYMRTPVKKNDGLDAIDKIFGKWKDDRTTEEIIDDIYSSRMSDDTNKLVSLDD